MGSKTSASNSKVINRNEIHKQMKNSIYKIYIDGKDRGFGFLSLSPNTKTKILITNYNCIGEEIIKAQKEIKLAELFSQDYQKIKTKNQRAFYMNENDNISIIEITDKDDIKRFRNISYLEYDEKINSKNINAEYKNQMIYIPYIPKENDDFPIGEIKSIDKYIIKHKCKNIEDKQFYFPILLLNNNKLIGFNCNKEKGIFLKHFLDEFEKKVNELNEREKSEIEEESIKSINITPSIRRKSKEEINDERKKLLEENKKEFDDTDNPSLYVKKSVDKTKSNIFLSIEVKEDDINKEIYFLDARKDRKEIEGFLKEIENIKSKIKINIRRPGSEEEEKEEIAFDNKFKPDIEGIYSIEIEIPGRVSDCSYMFYDCCNLYEVNLSKFDFTDVKNMSDMFNYCVNLKKVEFSEKNIDTVENMSYMFNHCKKLETIILKTFNTKNVTNMAGMFQHCEALKVVDVSNFDTMNVVQLSCMFNNCYNLENIFLPKQFRTDKIMLMPWMFYGCEQLKNLDFSSLEVLNKIDMNNMFDGCKNLSKIMVKKDNIYFRRCHKKLEDKFELI